MARRRIGLLYDYTFAQRPGGAQRVAERIAGSVPLNEVDLIPCPPGGVDLDCTSYALLQTQQYSDTELEHVCASKFIRYEQGYWRDSEPQAKWRSKLNAKAQLVALCSPLHLSVYSVVHASELNRTCVVIPRPLDPNLYHALSIDGRQRGDRAIWYGSWKWMRGADIVQKWAGERDIELDLYSYDAPAGTEPDNQHCTIVGGKLHDKALRDLLPTYGTFVYMPREPVVFGYNVVEANLSGLEVVLAGRIGCESFHKSLQSVADECGHAAENFWDVCLNA